MIWAEKAKQYLAALAAFDYDLLEELYDDNVELHDWNVHLIGKDNAIAKHKASQHLTTVNIRIQHTCYHDKYICLECILVMIPTEHSKNEDCSVINSMIVVQFNDYGKIQSVKFYEI